MINWIKRCFRYVFSFVGVFMYIGATAGERASRFGRWLYEDMGRWIFGASVAFILFTSFWTGFYLVLHFGKGMMVKCNATFARVLLIPLPVFHQKVPYSERYSILGTVA